MGFLSGLFLGLFIGAALGVLMVCLCIVAKDDKYISQDSTDHVR